MRTYEDGAATLDVQHYVSQEQNKANQRYNMEVKVLLVVSVGYGNKR